MRNLALAALAAALAPLPALADVLTVGPSGSGADFTSITPAFDAALDGDTVYVAPGTYSEPSGFRFERSITLLGAGSDQTVILIDQLTAQLDVAAWFDSLAPGASAALIGFSIGFEGVPLVLHRHLVQVDDCAGKVLIQDIRPQAGAVLQTLEAMVVRDSAQVVVEDSVLVGMGDVEAPGEAALEVRDSTVLIHNSELFGGSGVFFFFTFPGAPAVTAYDSIVRVSDSALTGAGGGDGGGIQAASLSNSNLITRGTTTLQGGASSPAGGLGVAAIEIGPGSLMTRTPGVQVLAGADANGQVTQPGLVLAGGQLIDVPEELATLTAAPALVSGGDALTMTTGGEPGSTAILYRGAAGPLLDLPNFIGPLQLSIPSAIAFTPQVLGAGGTAATPLTVPVAASFVGRVQPFQALNISPGLRFSISNAAHVAIAPQ